MIFTVGALLGFSSNCGIFLGCRLWESSNHVLFLN